jgi:hypothetical protein
MLGNCLAWKLLWRWRTWAATSPVVSARPIDATSSVNGSMNLWT